MSTTYSADVELEVAGLRSAAHESARGTTGRAALVKVCRHLIATTAPLVLADLITLASCGLLARVVLHLLHHAPGGSLGWAGPLALACVLFAYALGGLYSGIGTHPANELRKLVEINTIGLLAVAAGSFVRPVPAWCALVWLFALVLVPLARAAARHYCARASWWGYPTLVISSGEAANTVAETLLRSPASGLRPVAIVNPMGACSSAALPIAEDFAAARLVAEARAIRHAVVFLPELPHERLTEVVDRYRTLIPHLLILSDSSTLPSLWVAARSCGRLSGTEMRNGLMLTRLQVLKRGLDLALGVLGLLAALPVLLVVAALVKLTSAGPIVYGHRRIGFGGQSFVAWKFRTMYVNGDALLREHLRCNPAANEEWQRDHKLRDDPRVTPLGKFLRKSSLDEFPQIWNVLAGEMSLVGPRPIVTAEIPKYGPAFKLYMTIKPGITGLWQVSGRNDTSYEDRVYLDQYFIRNWSPWVDLYILARTVVALVRQTGAY